MDCNISSLRPPNPPILLRVCCSPTRRSRRHQVCANERSRYTRTIKDDWPTPVPMLPVCCSILDRVIHQHCDAHYVRSTIHRLLWVYTPVMGMAIVKVIGMVVGMVIVKVMRIMILKVMGMPTLKVMAIAKGM